MAKPEVHADRGSDSKRRALVELLRLAEEDLARGIRHWFDPAVAQELRELVREVSPLARVQAGQSSMTGSTSIIGNTLITGNASASGKTSAPSRAPSRGGGSVLWNRPRPEPSASGAGSDFESVQAGAFGGSAPPGSGRVGSKKPTWGPPPTATGRDSDWQAQLEEVGSRASVCVACGLCRTRKKVVFGVGSGRVPLVFVGEAPGADEDEQGYPFVGRAGQLLTRIIEAIGLRREDVYICNVLKCRPPGNRNPEPEEIEKCTPFLERQLEILRPKVICPLGLFAAQHLLNTKEPIGKLRGRRFDYKGIPVLPTYHPAALLRNPALKATVWEDVQLLRKMLDE